MIAPPAPRSADGVANAAAAGKAEAPQPAVEQQREEPVSAAPANATPGAAPQERHDRESAAGEPDRNEAPAAQSERRPQDAPRAAAPPVIEQAKPADPLLHAAAPPAPVPLSQNVEVHNATIHDFNHTTSVHHHYHAAGEAAYASLVEFVRNLPDQPTSDPGPTAFVREELRVYADHLRIERMILISCDEPAFSRAAAAALIESLGLPPTHRKMLNFERIPESRVVSLYQLTSERIVASGEVVVVADAGRSERAHGFVDSIYRCDGNLTQLDRTKTLHDAGVYLICLVDPERMTRYSKQRGELPVQVWKLSYLRFLLRPRFPKEYLQMEAMIVRQRQAGGWASDPAEFHKQIVSLTDSELQDAIVRGGLAATHDLDQELAGSERLRLAALYTATFYPGLPPYDFGEVLTALAGDQKVVVVEAAPEVKEGVAPRVEKRERELRDLWAEQSDAVLRDCGLITVRESGRIIAFSEAGRRDQLRKQFEETFGVYVHNLFVAAYEHDLLFGRSDKVAENVIALTLDMAEAYPDQFGAEWFSSVISRVCGAVPDGDSARATLVYQRIVELLRAMLAQQTLARIVDEVLQQLLAKGRHRFVLELLKKLRFTPGFEVFRWFVRVLDEGTAEVREDAYGYLYGEMRQPGRLYPLLYTVRPWLPAADRENAYSASNKVPFRLLFDYCLEATFTFDRRNAGAWPSRFPLLALDTDNAGERLDLIASLLLHPALAEILDEQAGHPPLSWFVERPLSTEKLDGLLAALVAEWVFFLLAPAPGNDARGHMPNASAEALVDLLIARMIERTNAPQQRGRQQTWLAYWETLKQHYLETIATAGDQGRPRPPELTWKRELVRKFITRFREMQRVLRPLPRTSRATA
ncbi:MAG TPA: hypothetical protein VF824_17435 [Thermoanaerobaculia bacterium]